MMNKQKNTPPALFFFPRRHAALLAGIITLIVIVLLLPEKQGQRTVQTIDIQPLTKPLPVSELEKPEPTRNWRWEEEEVKSGDSLSRIFQRVGVSANTLHRLTNSDEQAKRLTRIFPGHKLRFAFDENDTLQALQYIPSRLQSLDFTRQEDGRFLVEQVVKQPEIQLMYREATIDNSLFLAGQHAGISQGMIMQIADIFSGVIDFIFDPRKNDTFTVLYEEEYFEGEKIGNGRLLVVSYSGANRQYTAYRYESEDGSSGYYNADGESMRKAFLRAPLDFTRISSGFNLRRMHPIHNRVRAHRGIDYAAPRGTPVFAAGDGRVARAGYSAANGNYIFISHGSTYMTKYLHLDKRYVRTGQQVKQRTVIGTVGSTGYATGPHLHYEFLVNGVHRDPRTILDSLPSSDPIAKEEMARFEQHIARLQNLYEQRQQIAMSD